MTHARDTMTLSRTRYKGARRRCDTSFVANAAAPKMIFLRFGKYGWVDGVAEPIIASRTERSILAEMGIRDSGVTPMLDEALSLAEQIVEDAETGRVDLGDLGRRARRLLAATAKPEKPEQLF